MPVEFPLFYEDELLSSGCARYYDRMGYADLSYAHQDLFDCTSRVGFSGGIPMRLGVFAQRLPAGYPCSVDELLQRHTCLPYYAPFFSKASLDVLVHNILTATDADRMASSLAALRTPWRRMRYCPTCMLEDQQHTHGRERYWHRIHQAPGILVCAKHHTWLEESDVPSRGVEGTFASAARATLIQEPRDATSSPWYGRLEAIARESALLYTIPWWSADGGNVLTRYQSLLQAHAYLTLSGRLRVIDLANDLIRHFSPELLTALGWNLNNSTDDLCNQLLRLMKRTRQGSRPLLAILVTTFLGESVQALLSEPEPRGSRSTPSAEPRTALWPCANPVCAYYQIPTEHVQVVKSHMFYGHIIHRLTCGCGYDWTVNLLPGQSGAPLHPTKVLDYGSVWNAALRRLWDDQSQSIPMIARRLKIDRQTVTSSARKLGLRMPRSPRQRQQVADSEFHARLEARRIQLREFQQRRPAATRADLSKRERSLYKWFMAQDRLWLDQHLPPLVAARRRKHRPQAKPRMLSDEPLAPAASDPGLGVRGVAIGNAEFAAAIQAAARQMREEGRWYPITWPALRRRIPECPRHIHRLHLKKWPLAAAAVQEVVETGEQAALRRIALVSQRAAREGRNVTPYQLVHWSAALPYRGRPAIQQALQRALREAKS